MKIREICKEPLYWFLATIITASPLIGLALLSRTNEKPKPNYRSFYFVQDQDCFGLNVFGTNGSIIYRDYNFDGKMDEVIIREKGEQRVLRYDEMSPQDKANYERFYEHFRNQHVGKPLKEKTH